MMMMVFSLFMHINLCSMSSRFRVSVRCHVGFMIKLWETMANTCIVLVQSRTNYFPVSNLKAVKHFLMYVWGDESINPQGVIRILFLIYPTG